MAKARDWNHSWDALRFGGVAIFIIMISITQISSKIKVFKSVETVFGRIMKAVTSQPLTLGLLDNPTPKVIHASRFGLHSSSKLIIIGDVHGCLDELKILLDKCLYKKGDALIFVGDLVNKGPSSAGVVKFVREIGACCVRGNHDDAALAKYLKWKKKGKDLPSKYEYLQDLDEEDIEWLIQLPYTLSVPSHNAIIVHAGFIPGVPLEEQTPSNMYLLRTIPETEISNTASVTECALEDVPWASRWCDDRHVYFGHDAKRGLQLYDHATGLDTGCCYGRKLSAIILPERTIVQVDALKVYEEPKKS